MCHCLRQTFFSESCYLRSCRLKLSTFSKKCNCKELIFLARIQGAAPGAITNFSQKNKLVMCQMCQWREEITRPEPKMETPTRKETSTRSRRNCGAFNGNIELHSGRSLVVVWRRTRRMAFSCECNEVRAKMRRSKRHAAMLAFHRGPTSGPGTVATVVLPL